MNIFNSIKDLPARELMPGFKGRFVHTKSMTISYWEIKKGSELPAHSHPHEQTTNVIEGEMQLTVDGETRKLTFGDIVAIPSHAVHSGKALTDCIVIDVFSPVREDYRE